MAVFLEYHFLQETTGLFKKENIQHVSMTKSPYIISLKKQEAHVLIDIWMRNENVRILNRC